MSNSYYNHGTYPTPNSPGSSAALRAELESITDGFDLLPTLAGNAYKVAMVNSTGTALVASSSLQALSITNLTVTNSVINSTTIGATTPSTGAFTTVSASGGFTGNLTGNVTGTATNVTGVVAVVNGGTGATTSSGARVSLLPSLSGNAGKLLSVNGSETDVQFVAALGTGTVTSIDASGGTTGLSFSGGPVTAAGTLTLAGTLAAANGGTGLTSPGASGNVLTSNGTAWTSSVLPAGGLSYVFKTANYSVSDKEGVLADTSGGSFTVTLPATPATGTQVVVADAGNAWGTNNLTVGRNGSTIGTLAEDLVCDITGANVLLVYDGTTWEVYAQIGGNGGNAATLNGVETLTNKTIAFGSNTLTDVASTNTAQTLTNKTLDYNSNTFLNFPPPTPFSDSTALAQAQAIALSF